LLKLSNTDMASLCGMVTSQFELWSSGSRAAVTHIESVIVF
jgi:hypothetical protein